MAVYNPTYQQGQVTVGASPTLIATFISSGLSIVITNGAAAVFLGGSNVATSGASTGIQVAINGTVTLPVPSGQPVSLYGICATSTTVNFLYVE